MNLIRILIISIFILMTTANCGKNISEGYYSGNDILKNANIVNSPGEEKLLLNILTTGEWSLYQGDTQNTIDYTEPIAKGNDGGFHPLPITDSKHNYFQLETTEGSAIIAEKHLPMVGGYNFRDIGGIRTKDGKYVKWGKIFRSDELNSLTNSDLEYLASIPLVSIVDFRTDEEVIKARDKNPSTVKNNYHYPINPGNLTKLINNNNIANINTSEADKTMCDMYKLLVKDPTSIEQYKKLFHLLQNTEQVPLMFHCSAGKDRTGMGTALILFSLGVSEKDIFDDYLLSNTYLANKYDKIKEQYPNLKSFLEVKPEFLKSGINQILKDYGSIEHFLTNKLDVDINKMKELYLDEPVEIGKK